MQGPKTSTPFFSLSGDTGDPASRNTRKLELVHVRMREQCVKRGRRKEEVGGTVLLDRPQNLSGVEPR
jgi:hypothetical protein